MSVVAKWYSDQVCCVVYLGRVVSAMGSPVLTLGVGLVMGANLHNLSPNSTRLGICGAYTLTLLVACLVACFAVALHHQPPLARGEHT